MRAMPSSLSMLRRTTVGRTPLDECSAHDRDLYKTTHNSHKRKTSMPLAGFEPKISAGERQQNHALDRLATGISYTTYFLLLFWFLFQTLFHYFESQNSGDTSNHLPFEMQIISFQVFCISISYFISCVCHILCCNLIYFQSNFLWCLVLANIPKITGNIRHIWQTQRQLK